MNTGVVKILDGNTFVVSDAAGDIEASPTDPTGLFSFDTRFLSQWVLSIDGQRLTPLSTDDLNYFETRFFLVAGSGTVYVDSKLSVIRQRAVGDGFHEELTILNHDEAPVRLAVRIDAACDFADLFEIKDALEKQGNYTADTDAGELVLRYDRETFSRATRISCSVPARFDEKGVSFDVQIEPHGEWIQASTSSQPSSRLGAPIDRANTPATVRPGNPAWRRTSSAGSTRHHASSATGTR